MGTGERRRAAGIRERQRVLYVCAAVVLLFAISDRFAIGKFAWGPLLTRLGWALLVVGTARLLRTADPIRERRLLLSLAVLSPLFYAALTAMTGGPHSPLFNWMVALPVVIALVIQDHPGAVFGSGLTMTGGGVGILAASHASAGFCVQWAGQAAVLTSLAAFASRTYGRLHKREATLRRANDEADARAQASEAALRARDDFLAIAAHELRTPLTSLLLQIEAVGRGIRPVAGTATVMGGESGGLDSIARQARRLSELIDGMLDVSRLTTGRLDLDYAEVDLGTIVEEVAQRFSPDASAAACVLTVDLDRPLTGVWDPARLDQVVSNLLSNAIKYGAGAPVDITARAKTDLVRLTVRDRGVGIPAEDHQRIFRRFERAAAPRRYGGLGLGLWITNELCCAQGGRIDVESSPGAGASFTVSLPRRAPSAVAALDRRRLGLP